MNQNDDDNPSVSTSSSPAAEVAVNVKIDLDQLPPLPNLSMDEQRAKEYHETKGRLMREILPRALDFQWMKEFCKQSEVICKQLHKSVKESSGDSKKIGDGSNNTMDNETATATILSPGLPSVPQSPVLLPHSSEQDQAPSLVDSMATFSDESDKQENAGPMPNQNAAQISSPGLPSVLQSPMQLPHASTMTQIHPLLVNLTPLDGHASTVQAPVLVGATPLLNDNAPMEGNSTAQAEMVGPTQDASSADDDLGRKAYEMLHRLSCFVVGPAPVPAGNASRQPERVSRRLMGRSPSPVPTPSQASPLLVAPAKKKPRRKISHPFLHRPNRRSSMAQKRVWLNRRQNTEPETDSEMESLESDDDNTVGSASFNI